MNVDELVARVREAIRTGTVDGRRLEGCAFGPCSSSRSRGGAGCHMCDEIATLPQPRRRGAPLVVEAADAAWFGGDAGAEELHQRELANPTRDGAPKLSGERERGNLAFQKRRRQGPHRGNA